MKEIAQMLIAMNGKIVPKPGRKIKDEMLPEKNDQGNEELDNMIKSLLIKIFDFAISNMK